MFIHSFILLLLSESNMVSKWGRPGLETFDLQHALSARQMLTCKSHKFIIEASLILASGDISSPGMLSRIRVLTGISQLITAKYRLLETGYESMGKGLFESVRCKGWLLAPGIGICFCF